MTANSPADGEPAVGLTPCTCRQAVHARERRRPAVPGCTWCAASPDDRPAVAATCMHPVGDADECPCPPSCDCCKVTAASPRRDDLRELRAWLATERAKAELSDRPGCDPALLVTAHSGIAAGLSIALAWVNHRLGEALDSGPSVAEAAADDRRWFGGEKAGE